MLADVAVAMHILKNHMKPDSYVHGDKDGIHVYDIDIKAEEVWETLSDKEKDVLKKYGWVVDDGEFFKGND